MYKFYYARSHTRRLKVTISLVLKVGSPLIPLVLVLLAWLTATTLKLVWQNCCCIEYAWNSIRQHSRVALLSSVSLVNWEKQHQPNTLTMRKCVVVEYLSMKPLQSIYLYTTVSIYQIEPDPYIKVDVQKKMSLLMLHSRELN